MTLRRWRARHRGADLGFSYVEVVVAVVLIGLAGTAVLGAMAASAKGSGTHQRIANAQTWLASAADRIASPVLTRPGCAGASAAYTDAVAAAERPTGDETATLVVASVVSGTASGEFRTTCVDGDPLQLVTLRVVAGGVAVRELQIVKSDPPPPITTVATTAPTLPPNTVVPPSTVAPRTCTLALDIGASVATPLRVPNGLPASRLLNGFDLTLSVGAHIGLELLGNPLLALDVCVGAQVVYNTGLTQVTRTFPGFTSGFMCKIDLRLFPALGLNQLFDGLCSALQDLLGGVLWLINLLGIKLDIAVSASAGLHIPATDAEPWTSGLHDLLVLDAALNELKLIQVNVL